MGVSTTEIPKGAGRKASDFRKRNLLCPIVLSTFACSDMSWLRPKTEVSGARWRRRSNTRRQRRCEHSPASPWRQDLRARQVLRARPSSHPPDCSQRAVSQGLCRRLGRDPRKHICRERGHDPAAPGDPKVFTKLGAIHTIKARNQTHSGATRLTKAEEAVRNVKRGRGGTGRRKGLKIPRSDPYGFDSRRPHHRGSAIAS